MVVPSIGVVVHDDHRRAAPGRLGLQKVDGVHQEGLLIQGIGVSGVTICVSWSLEEADRGKVASCDCGEEVANIVLMVGGAGVSNLRQGSWTGMHGVGSRGVVAEKRVVGNVI